VLQWNGNTITHAPRAALAGFPPPALGERRHRGLARGASFDPLFGAREQGRRHIEAERPRALEVDHQLELCGLLDRKVGWLRTLKAVFAKSWRRE
jgi:hypothetical protein